MLRFSRHVIALGALALVGATPLAAQANLSDSFTLNPDTNPFEYFAFSVTQAGTFSLAVHSDGVDTYLWFFRGLSTTAGGLGESLGNNDSALGHEGSPNFDDAGFHSFLDIGDYTAAIGFFNSRLENVRADAYSGIYSGTGNYDMAFTVTSLDGQAVAPFVTPPPDVTPTPEPSSVALIATGLLAVAGLARRRRLSGG